MSKKERKKERISLDEGGKGFSHNPFAQLLKKSDDSVTDEVERSPVVEDEATKEASPDVAKLSDLPKVVLRRERKGRGGKTVTLIEGAEGFDELALDELARQVRKGLGCGASVEEGKIVVQGDQRERLESWLQGKGVKKIVLSG